MEVQLVIGALVCVHVWAEAEFKLHQTTIASSRFWKSFICQLWTNQPFAGIFSKGIFDGSSGGKSTYYFRMKTKDGNTPSFPIYCAAFSFV
jgi:hypothetical protein